MAAVISTLASTKFKPFAAQFILHNEAYSQGLNLGFGIKPAGWYIKLPSLDSPCDCSSLRERRDVILITKPKPKGKPA